MYLLYNLKSVLVPFLEPFCHVHCSVTISKYHKRNKKATNILYINTSWRSKRRLLRKRYKKEKLYLRKDSKQLALGCN